MFIFKKTLPFLILSAAVFLALQVKAYTASDSKGVPQLASEQEEGIEIVPLTPSERRAYTHLPSSQQEREKIFDVYLKIWTQS